MNQTKSVYLVYIMNQTIIAYLDQEYCNALS